MAGNPTNSIGLVINSSQPLTTGFGGTGNTSGQAVPFGSAGGDLTGSYPNPTIATNAVTYAKFQQIAANSLHGNPTGSTATSQAISLGTTLAFSGTALQTAALSGDVTTSANSFSTTVAKINGATLGSTIATSGNLLIGSGTQWVTNSISGNVTISSTGVTTIGVAQVTNAMLAGSIDLTSKVTGTLPFANGGLGFNTATAGDIYYTDVFGNPAKLSNVAVGAVLASTGVGQLPQYSTTPTVSTMTLSGITQTSVLFAGSGGLVSGDSSNFTWDETNTKLGIVTGGFNSSYSTVYFQVGASATDILSYNPNLSSSVFTSKTTNGGSSPSSPEPVTIWMRQGVFGQSYANIVDWKISRSANVGSNANTLLTLGLTGGAGDTTTTALMSWANANGTVSINIPYLTASSLVTTNGTSNLVATNTLSSTVLGNIPTPTITVFNGSASGNYTPPTGCTHFVVQGWGPGGGGGGVSGATSNSAAASGGGSGGMFLAIVDASSFSAPYAYTVGTGGGGAFAGNNNGNPGLTNTTFGSFSAGVGAAGTGAAASVTTSAVVGGAGGSASGSGALLTISGQAGGNGLQVTGAVAFGGVGGSAPQGGTGGRAILNGQGGNGSGPGAGGAGGTTINSTSRAGGNGIDGKIIIIEYYNG